MLSSILGKMCPIIENKKQRYTATKKSLQSGTYGENLHFFPKIRKKIDSVLLKNRLFFSLLHGEFGVFFRVRPNEFSYSMGQKGKKPSRKVKRCCSQHFSGYDIFFRHHSKGSTIKKLKHVLWGERMTPLLIVLMSYED